MGVSHVATKHVVVWCSNSSSSSDVRINVLSCELVPLEDRTNVATIGAMFVVSYTCSDVTSDRTIRKESPSFLPI